MAFLSSLFSSSPPQPSDLIAKLQSLQPLQSMQELETALQDFRDPKWVNIEGCSWKRVWQMHLFGLWRLLLETDEKVSQAAQECFRLHQASFERVAQQHRQLQQSVPPAQLTYNPTRELLQYLSVAGMAWHLSQQWNLHTNPLIGKFLSENQEDTDEFTKHLCLLCSPEQETLVFTTEQWAKFERFLWTSVAAIHYSDQGKHPLTWIDLLEEWSRWSSGEDPRCSILLNKLKAQLKLVKCGRIFSSVLSAPSGTIPGAVQNASEDPNSRSPQRRPEMLLTPSRHGRAGSRIGRVAGAAEGSRQESASTRNRAPSSEQAGSLPQVSDANGVANRDPDGGQYVPARERSLEYYLIERLLGQVKAYPWLPQNELREILEVYLTYPSTRKVRFRLSRHGLSLQLFLEEFGKLLNRSAPEDFKKTLESARKNLRLFFPDEEDARWLNCLKMRYVQRFACRDAMLLSMPW